MPNVSPAIALMAFAAILPARACASPALPPKRVRARTGFADPSNTTSTPMTNVTVARVMVKIVAHIIMAYRAPERRNACPIIALTACAATTIAAARVTLVLRLKKAADTTAHVGLLRRTQIPTMIAIRAFAMDRASASRRHVRRLRNVEPMRRVRIALACAMRVIPETAMPARTSMNAKRTMADAMLMPHARTLQVPGLVHATKGMSGTASRVHHSHPSFRYRPRGIRCVRLRAIIA